MAICRNCGKVFRKTGKAVTLCDTCWEKARGRGSKKNETNVKKN